MANKKPCIGCNPTEDEINESWDYYTSQYDESKIDPNTQTPINPISDKGYPAWYPSTLYNVGGQNPNTTDINPNTGEKWTEAEITAYKAPVEAGDPFAAGYQGLAGLGGASGRTCAGGVVGAGIGEVPPYEQSPELKAWQEKFGGGLADWLENPQGIPTEAKAQMKQSLYDSTMAKQEEDIRVMRNNMERRGITNSGFVYSNEQKIRSNTTKILAESYRNIEIQDAMMKVASWEKAMGQTAQYLGYLSNESYMAYQPKLMEWQAKFDVYKMQLNQAYQQQNIRLQGQITSQLNEAQNAFNMELAQMEIEANQQQAAAQGWGQIIGSVIGLIGSIIF